MKMPRRAEYQTSHSYICAMEMWSRRSEVFYQDFRRKYLGTPISAAKADWIDERHHVKHVALVECGQPSRKELEAALRNLAGDIFENCEHVKRLCRGIFEYGDGNPCWQCWVEIDDIKAALDQAG